jgi:hypothetical protein
VSSAGLPFTTVMRNSRSGAAHDELCDLVGSAQRLVWMSAEMRDVATR